MTLFDTIKAKAADLIAVDHQGAEPTPLREGRTPFAGFAVDEKTGNPIGLAPCGPHLLVLAGSGAGKSRRVLVPQILTWDGPVCAVSAKSDLAEMSAGHRAHRGGQQYVMDLTGQADWSQLPEGMIRVVNDPCALLVPDADGSTDDSAMDLATLLTQVGTLGTGGGQGSGGDSAFWMTLALGTLACLIQAGGWYPDPMTDEPIWGGGISWVLRAALDPGTDDDADSDELDLDTPSWDVAALRGDLLDSSHVAEIESTKLLDPKQRDSVGINLRVALSSWKKRSVRGDGSEQPFTPTLLEDPAATLYLVSPSSGTAAGAAASVIEAIVSHWTLNAIRQGLPKIAMVIDEAPQICPLPRLREHIGLMRSYGCHFTVAAQHSTQFKARFGEAESEALLQVFLGTGVLIGVGAIEKDILEQAAWTEPPTERQVSSWDAAGRESRSADRVELHGAELLPRHQGEGRLLVRGRKGSLVRLVDYTEMIA
ncbi:hypothetical protein QFZ53_002812 [Microbacterium natoriense]|uniref:TraD/TraG TraM recognition site domain-containing protein n=1 Tax=Microbacterium natoriense TaxID=284570 RepID=A0AAW8F2D1_9MICO|nr:type IV secretory system conjugative DNA transfer family protein [Microbacterium natoriense]MDQ0648616.1 hypothetical protein [Microbacterium natoriense]